jgi:hypothetical protein
VTEAIDLTPATDPENLERLADALRELGANLRVASDEVGVPFDISSEALAGAEMWTLTTAAGDVDLCFVPAGTRGYEDLRREASRTWLERGLVVDIASLRDVIRMKEAAGRATDLAQLPVLRRTLELVRERERDAPDAP